jgi:hypothetical protein
MTDQPKRNQKESKFYIQEFGSIRIPGVLAKIQIEHHQSTCLERHCYANPFGLPLTCQPIMSIKNTLQRKYVYARDTFDQASIIL